MIRLALCDACNKHRELMSTYLPDGKTLRMLCADCRKVKNDKAMKK